MSKIRLYIDEDSGDSALVLSLQNRDVDVITTLSANRLRYPDEEQLEWATEQGRVLYTSNVKDFYHLHTTFLTQGKFHGGIILVQQQRYTVGEQLRAIIRLIAAKSVEEMQNKAEFISVWID